MNIAQFTEQLRAGKLLFGTQVASPSPLWPSALSGIGLDCVFLDTEPIPVDRTLLSWMCQTSSHMGHPPLVRHELADVSAQRPWNGLRKQ